ncbi:hypothetical protein SK3146_01338 [Paenibacillus konkukensis]|uniref:Uncharacterized protein n=1 Tax=Paenibacillus konkukensis TaxID=2020716 RepID=A0ABY4RJZ0_9BACL|nr:hypothetical protein SK3146_01338 [Paenibacillus konkukensis]
MGFQPLLNFVLWRPLSLFHPIFIPFLFYFGLPSASLNAFFKSAAPLDFIIHRS